MDKYQKKLSHLNACKISSLINDYYNGKNINDLIQKYNIDIHSSRLIRTFPIKNTNKPCPYCHSLMFLRRKSKKSLLKEVIFCEKCNHKEMDCCYCNGCKAKIDNEEKENILKEYSSNKVMMYENLSFKDSFILYSLLSESGGNIQGIYKSSKLNLYPYEGESFKELSTLIEKKLLVINKKYFNAIRKELTKILKNKSKEYINKFLILTSHLAHNISRDGVNRIENHELLKILKFDLLQSYENYKKKEVFDFILELSKYEIKSVISDDFLQYFKHYQIKKMEKILDSLLKKLTVNETFEIFYLSYNKVIKRKKYLNGISHQINLFNVIISDFKGSIFCDGRHEIFPRCKVSQLFCTMLLNTTDDYFPENIYSFFDRKSPQYYL